MPTIFVLDVPEFRPLVEHARSREGIAVIGPNKGYFRLSSSGRLRFDRKAIGFKPAVWNGALTGGLAGRIERFDNDALEIVDI